MFIKRCKYRCLTLVRDRKPCVRQFDAKNGCVIYSAFSVKAKECCKINGFYRQMDLFQSYHMAIWSVYDPQERRHTAGYTEENSEELDGKQSVTSVCVCVCQGILVLFLFFLVCLIL